MCLECVNRWLMCVTSQTGLLIAEIVGRMEQENTTGSESEQRMKNTDDETHETHMRNTRFISNIKKPRG